MSNAEGRKESFISKLLIAVLVGVVVLMLIAVIGSYFHWVSRSGAYRKDISGKIVDQQTIVQESNEGSSINRKPTIEEAAGKRTQVSVNESVCGQAEIGMRFERSQAGDQVRSSDSSGR